MSIIRTLIVMICMTCLAPLAFAQGATPPRITPADAKNHRDEVVTVCGKVVDAKVPKYGLAGHGKPVSFYIDQPEATSEFLFVTFGTQAGGADEAVAAYQGKNVCVTGKISVSAAGGPPFIMQPDRTQIKPQAEGK